MQIDEFTADDTAVVDEVVEMTHEIERVDSPWVHPATTTTFSGMLRHGWDGEAPRAFVARETADGRAVGVALYWVSEWDNRELAWLDLAVRPDARRRGVGTALLEAMKDLARETGRTKLGADGWDSEATRGFAARHGFEVGSQAVNRRQDLADVDADVLAKLYDEAALAASDYELIRLVGATPDDLIDDVVVMTAAINDAPTDDLDIEDEVFTVERVRGYEAAVAAKRQRSYHLVARHRAGGELAGHTIVVVEEERPTIGHQHDTSVLEQHRGHRLGLLLKAGMLQWLAEAEPQLASIDTWNAESNDHMIGVNEQLGYRVLGRGLELQRPL